MPVEVTLSPEVRGHLSVHPIAEMHQFNIDAFITDRFGGVSLWPFDSLNLAGHVGDQDEHVKENRRRVAEAIGVEPDRLITIPQVHGNVVVGVDGTSVEGEGDGLVSARSDVALAMLVADCAPILLVDASSSHFGVVHAGWRGLAGGVLASAMVHFPNPREVHAFVGPCISREGYQIGPEVAAHFSSTPEALYVDTGDRSRLDLRQVIACQMRDLGLIDEHVGQSRQSTDGGEVFFSDRAQRPCGRFALVAKRSS